jgi:hypothetical protein
LFVELICDLPCSEMENVAEDSLPDESLFMISSNDLWYGDTLAYLVHFATVVSTLMRRYVVDMAMNLESLKCRFR